MPSIMTLEGPRLGCGPCQASGKPIGAIAMPTGGKLALFAIGGAALLGVAYLFTRPDRRRPLRGPSMLQTIARESKTANEFARRAEAWNASERDPLPVAKLAKAFKKAKPATVARLIREAHESRVEGRERLWTRMSRGLRGVVGLDGYRVAYGTSGGGKTYRAFDDRTVDTIEQATKLMRSYKRRGFWTWVEDEQGNFIAVPGAKSEKIRKSYPLRGAIRTTLGPRGRNV